MNWKQELDQPVRLTLGRALLCVVFPPLGVYDRGCGTIIMVAVFMLLGWIPGVLAAMVINHFPPGPTWTDDPNASQETDWRKQDS